MFVGIWFSDVIFFSNVFEWFWGLLLRFIDFCYSIGICILDVGFGICLFNIGIGIVYFDVDGFVCFLFGIVVSYIEDLWILFR